MRRYKCKQCGGKMDIAEFDMLICSVCGDAVDLEDYDTVYVKYSEQVFTSADSLLAVPAGCRACGGDYPHCKASCSIFDE